MSWGKTFPCDWPTPGWWFVDSKIQLLPPKDILENLDLLASWAPEGTDLDGADGWSLALDTTVLEEGYHFVKATMVDSSGSNGTEITEVFVDNIPPVPGDHDVAITSLEASDTFIAVVVENQGLYNETAYVSVYYRTTDPTKRVDLESGANATLQFEWTPSTGFYAITAEVDRVMDELDTADNILIITTTIITSSSESSSSQPLESNVNMIILGFCLLSASLAVPQLLERKESDFETIALAHKQNLNATTTESVWQNPIGRQYV